MHTVPHAAGSGDAVATAYHRFGHPIRLARSTNAGRMRADCKLDRMVSGSPPREAWAMPALVSRPELDRAPDNELYDRGCDLVQAAAAIRAAAAAPEAVRAIPAVLGCIEAALHELSEAAAALEETTERSSRKRSQARRAVDPMRERMHQGYANLRQALTDAERASTAARPLAGRLLTAIGELAARP